MKLLLLYSFKRLALALILELPHVENHKGMCCDMILRLCIVAHRCRSSWLGGAEWLFTALAQTGGGCSPTKAKYEFMFMVVACGAQHVPPRPPPSPSHQDYPHAHLLTPYTLLPLSSSSSSPPPPHHHHVDHSAPVIASTPYEYYMLPFLLKNCMTMHFVCKNRLQLALT